VIFSRSDVRLAQRRPNAQNRGCASDHIAVKSKKKLHTNNHKEKRKERESREQREQESREREREEKRMAGHWTFFISLPIGVIV